jgi:hypothetical protein
MSSRPLPTRGQAFLVCACVAVTVIVCAGLLSAAALVPAPPAAVPFIIVICIAFPMFASWELRPSLAILRMTGGVRRRPRDARLLAEMSRYLEQLPETRHPLDG